MNPQRRHREWLNLPLLAILIGAAMLRMWSIGHGLPYVYNVDEELHFVSRAIAMFGESLDPTYFKNPPALTYLLHVVFRLSLTRGSLFSHASHVRENFAVDPTSAFLVARVVVAILGTAAVGLIYRVGRQLFDKTVGLVAAALLATAFLPMFYSKQALNDVVTLVPVTLSITGCVRVWQRGRLPDWVVTGSAIGVATATKYTAILMVVTLGVSALLRWERTRDTRTALFGLSLSGVAIVLVYLALNPYTLIDLDEFWSQMREQSHLTSAPKPGQEESSALMYYLWTLTWGLGWIPLAAIAVGVIVMVRRAARTALLLLSFPLALLALLSLQARYFGRWLLPIYPALAVLAAYGAVQSTYWLVSRRPRLRMTAIMAMATLLCAQGLSSSIHVNAVLGRRDTRELLREWLDENLPRGTQIVVEPFTPRGMFASADRLNSPEEWKRYPAKGHSEIYQQDLEPARIDDYRLAGYCWVVTASYQQERGINEGLEGSLAYYTRLRTEADLVAVFSPYREGDDPVRFNFDLSYNFYPSAYERPGPEIRVYRLRRCEQDMSGGGE